MSGVFICRVKSRCKTHARLQCQQGSRLVRTAAIMVMGLTLKNRLPAACSLPIASKHFSHCKGYELVSHRSKVARAFLQALERRFESSPDLRGVSEKLHSKASVRLVDVTDAHLGPEIYNQTKLVYMFDVLFSDILTENILTSIAKYAEPGFTRVAMHRDVRAKFPEILGRHFEVLLVTRELSPQARHDRQMAQGTGASAARRRDDALQGSLVVLQLKKRREEGLGLRA